VVQAKAVINVKTHPNVFDLESMFITIITRFRNLHTSRSSVRTDKGNQDFSSLEQE
jgi:hypothetical protein